MSRTTGTTVKVVDLFYSSRPQQINKQQQRQKHDSTCKMPQDSVSDTVKAQTEQVIESDNIPLDSCGSIAPEKEY